MFYSSKPQQASGTGGQPRDITVREAIALVVFIVVCGGGAMLARKIDRFYFQNFEMIYYVGYGLIAVIAAMATFRIIKKTKPLAERMARLGLEEAQGDTIFVGKAKEGALVYISDAVRTGHVQILGATGKGKTDSVILPWLVRDVARGHSTIVIDGKGDPGFASTIQEVCNANGPKAVVQVFDLGDPSNSTTINPLANGSPQMLADRIMTSFTFEDPYYKAVQADITRDLIALMQEPRESSNGHRLVTFKRFHQLLTSDEALSDEVSKCTDKSIAANLTRFLSEPRKERDQRTRGLVSQIAPFAVGELAELVNGPKEGQRPDKYMSVADLVMKKGQLCPKIMVFLISTLRYQDIGHQLGKLLLQELGWAVGARTAWFGGGAPFLPVYMDEFAGFVYPGFINILNKARSAQVALHMSHQSLGDLEQVSPEFAKTVNSNSNVKCLLGLNDPETADFFARHIGTRTEEKLTERAQKSGWFRDNDRTGEMSIREVEAYKIHPNVFKEFTAGQGVIHFPTKRGNVSEIIQFARLTEQDCPK